MIKFYLSLTAFLFTSLGIAQCNPPTISSAGDPDPICSGSTATITAVTSAGTLNWYANNSSTTILGSGSSFTTPFLSATTSFWVDANETTFEPTQTGGGKPAPTSTSASSVVNGTKPWGLVFNATQNFLLNSVDVFLTSPNAGIVVMELKDEALNVIQSFSIPVPAGGSVNNPVQFALPLNIMIPVGEGYRLVVVSNPPMIRDIGSNAFPFPIGTVGTVTQGTINNSNSNSGVYYFLYNWNVTPYSICTSVREEVVVTVNPTPATPTGDANQEFTEGQSLANLEVSGTNLTWYSDADSTNQIPDSTPLVTNTTYYVSQTVGSCESTPLAITVTAALALDNHIFSTFKLYPNPSANTINLQNATTLNSVQIFTLQGRKVFENQLNSTNSVVDISNLSSGTYLLKVVSESATKTLKVVKL